jgi:tetratricopeptide (TPR) repeat protein
MDSNTSEELKSIRELLQKAWHIYRTRMRTLLGVWFAAIFLPVLAIMPLVVLGYFGLQGGSGSNALIMVATFLVGTAAAVWLGNWGIAAFLTVIVDEQIGIKEAFSKAKPLTLAHIWLGILTGFIVAGGYFLLFIPGIIFSVWFFFAPFVFISEDARGMDALLKSKAYVSGKWIPVGIRLMAVWLLSVFVSLIPLVGQLLALFLIPLCFIYTFLVYKDLKTLKGAMELRPSKKEKLRFVAASAFGFVMPFVFVFAFMGSMFFMPFSMLKAKVAGTSPFPMDTPQDAGKGTFSVTPAGPVMNHNMDNNILVGKDKGGDTREQSQAALRLGQSQNKAAVLSVNPEVKGKKKKQGDPSEHVATGLSGTESKQYRDLIQTCEKALRIEPTDSPTYHNRAVAYFRLGQYQEAINDFTEAIKHDDKDAVAYYNRAIAYGMLGEYEKAIEDGIMAVKLNPEDAGAYANRGVDYIAVGKFNEAVDDFTQAVTMKAADASVYYARGVAYHKLGAEEQALEDFKHAAKKGYQKAREYLKARGQS